MNSERPVLILNTEQLLVSVVFFSLTLAGQRVVSDDGDAEALSVLLGQRNLVDLVSFQVGLNQNKHSSDISAETNSSNIEDAATQRKLLK